MRTVDQVLETLDNKLDEVDELLNALPLKAERNRNTENSCTTRIECA